MDELRGAIELHRAEDEGEKQEIRHERLMLRSVLELQEIEVDEIMTHRRHMATIDLKDSNQEIVNQVLDSQHTRLPVFDDDPDNIVGVLHA